MPAVISKHTESMNSELKKPLSTGPGTTSPAPEPAISELDLLRKELAGQKDLHLRLAADFENFKRRSRQESETRAAAQKESFIHELLPILDNLERALTSGASPAFRQFHQGVEMTWQQLRQLLNQHGIETAEIVGQPFDPHQHEAISQRHDPAHPNHTILEVFQRGYKKGEKIIRPAKVVVNDLAHSKEACHGS
jgi:molecular chaperone GrpE